jgi:hypothetical protein
MVQHSAGVKSSLERSENLQQDIGRFENLFKDRKVLNGPFKGMIYPTLDAIGSGLFPKLIGSYEHELWQTIETIRMRHYSEVVNVGCGEGYYTVGIALQHPHARVFAYDTNADARSMCTEMARANGVSNRIQISEFCSADELKNFKWSGRNLILCDCEGFEKHLFTADVIGNLKNSDLLIETHDFIDIDISDELKQLFEATHLIQSLKSIDDIEKARTYSFPQTVGFDLATRKKLFSEGRPAIMEWLFLTPLTGQ